MKYVKSAITLLTLAFATGCAGGGGSPSAPAPVAPNVPVAPNAPVTSSGKTAASISVVINTQASPKQTAHGTRKRNYVSPATQGLIATFVNASNVTTYQGYTLAPNVQLTASSPASCSAPSGDSFTCTIILPHTAAGSPYTTTITAYDGPQSGTTGVPAPAKGKQSALALSVDTETVNIVAGQNNQFTFTLHGIVEAFSARTRYIGVPAFPTYGTYSAAVFLLGLDGDDYVISDGEPYYSGQQPNGPFAPISFPFVAFDENGCFSSPCTSPYDPYEPVVGNSLDSPYFPYGVYNGQGNPGNGTTIPPYYGVVALGYPSGYSGFVSSTFNSTPYAATAYVVPFFGIVDPTSSKRVDASDVLFTGQSDTANVYALQYGLPDGSPGYSISSTGCGSGSSAIASASAPSSISYGAVFTLSAGPSSGTCTFTLSDGAGDVAYINVASTVSGQAQNAGFETEQLNVAGSSVPLPPVGGVTGTFSYPSFSNSFQNLPLLIGTSQTSPDNGYPGPMSRSRSRHAATRHRLTTSGTATPLYYVTLEQLNSGFAGVNFNSATAVTLCNLPGVSSGTAVYLDSGTVDEYGDYSDSGSTQMTAQGNGCYLASAPQMIGNYDSSTSLLTAYIVSGGTPSNVVANPSSLSFSSLSGTQNFAASESGYSGTFTASSSNTNVATVSSADGVNFTVTPTGAGTANITVSDSSSNTATVGVTVTTTTVTGQ